MNRDDIHTAFAELLAERAVHKKLGCTSNYIRTLRFKLANAKGISTDLKLELLQKSGWRQSDHSYTQADLVKAIKFALRQSAAAKSQGAEYLAEKYLQQKK